MSDWYSNPPLNGFVGCKRLGGACIFSKKAGDRIEACAPVHQHVGNLDVADRQRDHQRELVHAHRALGVVFVVERDSVSDHLRGGDASILESSALTSRSNSLSCRRGADVDALPWMHAATLDPRGAEMSS